MKFTILCISVFLFSPFISQSGEDNPCSPPKTDLELDDQVSSLNNKGLNMLSGKDSPENFIKKVLLYARIEQDSLLIPKTYMMLGTYLSSEGHLDRAIEAFKEATIIYEDKESYYQLTTTYEKIGSLYKKLNDYSQSLKYLSKAAYYNKQQGNYTKLIDNYINKARIHSRSGLFDSAKYNINKALQIAAVNQNPDLSASAYMDLSDIETAQGDTALAVRALEKSVDWSLMADNQPLCD